MAKPKDETPADDDADEGTKPTYVTVEQLNQAMSAKFNEFANKKLPKLLEGALAPLTASISEAIGKAKESEEGAGAAKGKESEELAKLRKDHEATQKALRAMEEDRKREAAESSRQKRSGLLQAALTKVGITNPTLANAAAKLLEDRVLTGEDGRVVFKRENAYGVEEMVDVERGVGDWMKTDDGKAFAPARKVAGSGNQPGGAPGRNPFGQPQGQRQQMDPAQALAAKRAAARTELANAMLGLPPAGSGDE